jgi:hypothetical protein
MVPLLKELLQQIPFELVPDQSKEEVRAAEEYVNPKNASSLPWPSRPGRIIWPPTTGNTS